MTGQLSAPCCACGQPVTRATGCWWIDTASTRAAEMGEPGGMAYARKHARWHIAHTECLPREDYGDGHFEELWTLYAPDFPSDFGALQELADHLCGKRWMPYTDLAAFLTEAVSGRGRWAPRVGQESA